MITVNKRLPAGQGLAPALLKRATTVTLDWDQRQKSRFEATDSQGRSLGVFLPRGTQVRGGDVLVADDGSLVRVQAAPQPVMVVTHCAQHGSPFDLMRAAYHLGNRHVALALQADRLLLEPDHVLADMLRQMHLVVTESNEAFEPEGGAYAAGSGHGHDHGSEPGQRDGAWAHGHEHSQAPAPASAAAPVHGHAPSQAHVHGPDCQHDPAPVVQPVHVHGPGCRHGHGH